MGSQIAGRALLFFLFEGLRHFQIIHSKRRKIKESEMPLFAGCLFIFLLQQQHMEEDCQEDHRNKEEGASNQPEEPQATGAQGMSKKQIKKQIKKEQWEKEKLIRRKQKREKEKLKKKEKKTMVKEQKEPEPQGMSKEEARISMRKRREDYADKMKEGLQVIIDLQFWDLMHEKEQASLIKQLSHCHSTNRKSQKCFNFILTSATKQRQQILAERYNADKWGITMYEQSLVDVFPIEKLVYMTGDAAQDLEKFDPELIYIIGGIVDHNRLKNITSNFANEHKIASRRLPMYNVKLKASVHFAVNHVWEWMLKGYNGMDWGEALKSIIPQRKLEELTEQ